VRLARWPAKVVLLSVLGAACSVPPPQYALTVRDPDKVCRLIAFSRCARQPNADADAASDTDAGLE
jgi:hypothetical protein